MHRDSYESHHGDPEKGNEAAIASNLTKDDAMKEKDFKEKDFESRDDAFHAAAASDSTLLATVTTTDLIATTENTHTSEVKPPTDGETDPSAPTDPEAHPQLDGEQPTDPPQPLKKKTAHIAVTMASLCASVFVAALDVTIITTALPAIVEHFHSDSGYTWIGSAYILAHTASTPVWGKISDIWGRRPILLIALAIFFAGSLICSLVNTMALFIFGRAVQGLGAAGLQTMVNICISDLFSLRDRGLYFGLVSVVWAFASGVGPILGGLFTDKVTWRWCFWINLPITAVVFVGVVFALKLETPRTPVIAGLKAIDWTGGLLIIGATLMLLIGLDFGGVNYAWSSAMVVCLIVFGVVTGGLFALNEWRVARYPIIPLSLFRNPSSLAAFAMCFCHAYVFMGVAYYLPLYCQSVLAASALMSGVYLLPFIVSLTLSAAVTGVYIQLTGRYLPAVYPGLLIMTLGIGLLIDLPYAHALGKLIGFQIVGGVGVGMIFESPLLAVQAVAHAQDVAAVTATISFVRALSTAISVVIGGVVFQNRMLAESAGLARALGAQTASALSGGSAEANIALLGTLPGTQQTLARQAYYRSLRVMWIMYVAFSGLALCTSFFLRPQHLSREHRAAVLGLKGLEAARDAPATTTTTTQATLVDEERDAAATQGTLVEGGVHGEEGEGEGDKVEGMDKAEQEGKGKDIAV